MLTKSHKMPNYTRSIAKMSLKFDSAYNNCYEYLTAPRNKLYIIFDLNIIFMLILFREKNHRRKFTNYNGTSTSECLFYRLIAPVAQLIEHRVIMREVVSSTPAGPTLRVLKITE